MLVTWSKAILVKKSGKATEIVDRYYVGSALEEFGDYTMCIDSKGEVHMVSTWKLRLIETSEEN